MIVKTNAIVNNTHVSQRVLFLLIASTPPPAAPVVASSGIAIHGHTISFFILK